MTCGRSGSMSPGRMSLGSLRMAPSRMMVFVPGCRALDVVYVTTEQPLREPSPAAMLLQALQQRYRGDLRFGELGPFERREPPPTRARAPQDALGSDHDVDVQIVARRRHRAGG